MFRFLFGEFLEITIVKLVLLRLEEEKTEAGARLSWSPGRCQNTSELTKARSSSLFLQDQII